MGKTCCSGYTVSLVPYCSLGLQVTCALCFQWERITNCPIVSKESVSKQSMLSM